MSTTNLDNNQIREFVWKIETKKRTKENKAKRNKEVKNVSLILEDTEKINTNTIENTARVRKLEKKSLLKMMQLLLEKVSLLEQNIKILRAENAVLHQTIKAIQQDACAFTNESFLTNF
ncbi:MAG: hypothetical protein NZ519_03130 [Bacteroidia bacterium]|nr:hypothetical protein [Bacteroidia bacterium]MDW8300877.1 hypothetical protein [Bacteroidia bacterium]